MILAAEEMHLAGVHPTLSEFDAMPNTLRRALALVGVWRAESEREHQARLLEAATGGGRP